MTIHFSTTWRIRWRNETVRCQRCELSLPDCGSLSALGYYTYCNSYGRAASALWIRRRPSRRRISGSAEFSVAAVNPPRNTWPSPNFNVWSSTVYFVKIQYTWPWTVFLMYNDRRWQMTWLTMWSDKGRPTVVCSVLHFYFIDISENFRGISAE